jgi:hypothetical protein
MSIFVKLFAILYTKATRSPLRVYISPMAITFTAIYLP